MLRLIIAALLLPASAAAQEVRVAIGDVGGRGGGKRAIGKLQKQIRRLPDVAIQSTRGFKREAKRMRVHRRIPEDAQALADLCEATNVDAVVYGRLVKPKDRKRRRRKDKDLELVVYSGRTGEIVGEQVIEVRKGRLTTKVWKRAAAAIEPDLRASLPAPEPPPPPPPPPPRYVEPEPQPVAVFDDPIPLEGPEPQVDFPRVRIYGGLMLLSRSFSYTTNPDSPSFSKTGIEYESSVVPGPALDAEVYPLAFIRKDALRGIGLGLSFAKVFLSTKQTRERDGMTEAQELDTQHHQFELRVLYRHRLWDDPLSPELGVHFGYGNMAIAIEENPEYDGTVYDYVSLGLSGQLPLFTEMLALDLAFSALPYADMGDSVEEVGAKADTSGWTVYAGLSSKILGELVARLGLEYTSLSSDISGEGRGGRVGEDAEDTWLSVRLQMGYHY